MMRSPRGGLSAGMGMRKVSLCPRWGREPREWTLWGPNTIIGDGFPTAGIGCPRWRTRPTARAVALLQNGVLKKQGQSGGSLGTIYQGQA